ncbi:MAG: hypothetical protein ABWY81_06120 [Jiangellaceae bacterium]
MTSDRTVSPLGDRRQSALEAFIDSTTMAYFHDVQHAIETATRVKITDDIVTAMLTEVDRVGVQNGGIETGLAAAFRAAGFEVVE